ncbi:Periplasmic substrate-binding protein [Pseudomonas savastanoi]|uniref:Periplasmic substrate-binding protein n=20 Tax=Pseudomonas TaxID=286 RepID=A0A3M6A4B3_PSESS|nr:Periplasmic substrate-binding protein [Pseudomonas savastanoi]
MRDACFRCRPVAGGNGRGGGHDSRHEYPDRSCHRAAKRNGAGNQSHGHAHQRFCPAGRRRCRTVCEQQSGPVENGQGSARAAPSFQRLMPGSQNMKQWLSISLSASLLVAGLAQAATPLIGVGMAKYNDNFQTILRHGVEKQVALLDADIFMENGQDDVELQMRQFRNLVNSKVDAIVVAMVNGKSAAEMMRLANEAKVPLVFVNRNPEPAKWPALTAFVGSDELESGTLQMEELARRAGYKGNVVILVGDPSNKSSVMRTEDVEKVVAKYPNMKVVQKKIGNWERSQAATIVIDWVKQGVDFSIVAANNDEMAIGAIMGLEKAGKNARDYLVGGIDGTPDGLKLMAEGKMAVSVFQDAVGQANGAVDAALSMARGETLASPVIWVPFKLITPENRQQFE